MKCKAPHKNTLVIRRSRLRINCRFHKLEWELAQKCDVMLGGYWQGEGIQIHRLSLNEHIHIYYIYILITPWTLFLQFFAVFFPPAFCAAGNLLITYRFILSLEGCIIKPTANNSPRLPNEISKRSSQIRRVDNDLTVTQNLVVLEEKLYDLKWSAHLLFVIIFVMRRK